MDLIEKKVENRESGWFVDLAEEFSQSTGAYDVKIVGIGMKPANQFQANPNNWRKHPQEQRDAMRDILGTFGFVNGVLENRRTGNLLDGHERIWEALAEGEETLVPYIQIDISEEDEIDLIIVYDKVGEMVYADNFILQDLIQNSTLAARSDNFALLLNKIHKDYKLTVNTPETPKEEIVLSDTMTETEKPSKGHIHLTYPVEECEQLLSMVTEIKVMWGENNSISEVIQRCVEMAHAEIGENYNGTEVTG